MTVRTYTSLTTVLCYDTHTVQFAIPNKLHQLLILLPHSRAGVLLVTVMHTN